MMDASLQAFIRFLEDVWNFCWVPLLTLALACLTARFVYPPSKDWALRALQSAKRGAAKLSESKDAFSAVGISKLIPVFAFAVVIAVFMLVNNIVYTWMPPLPPGLEVSTHEAAISGMSERDQILFLRAFPSADDTPAEFMTYREAYAQALDAARASEGLASRCGQVGLAQRTGHGITKALWVTSLVVFLISLFRWKRVLSSLWRFALVTLVLSVVWCGFSLTYILEARQSARCEYAAASQVVAKILGPDGFGPSTAEEETRIQEYEESVADFRDRATVILDTTIVGQDWWRVTLLTEQLRSLTLTIWTEYRMWRWSLGYF